MSDIAYRDVLKLMEEDLDELRAMQINVRVNYGQEGLKKLWQETTKSVASAQRAAAIMSQAYMARGGIEVWASKVRHDYESETDQHVESVIRQHSSASWEERRSIINVKCVDKLVELRRAENTVALAQATFKAMEEMAFAIRRQRQDLVALTDIMTKGDLIGEL